MACGYLGILARICIHVYAARAFTVRNTYVVRSCFNVKRNRCFRHNATIGLLNALIFSFVYPRGLDSCQLNTSFVTKGNQVSEVDNDYMVDATSSSHIVLVKQTVIH